MNELREKLLAKARQFLDNQAFGELTHPVVLGLLIAVEELQEG